MRRVFTLLAVIIVFSMNLPKSIAQVTISNGQTITQVFDGIGLTTTATLPSGWKVSKDTSVRTVGLYSTALTATERIGGNSMSTTASNGIYNYGAGDAATALDRAVGFLSSSSSTKSGNLYLMLQNNGSASINSFKIGFDVEKYRSGKNPAGFTVQLYYSTDGTNWTNAGANLKTDYPAGDTANTGFTSAPGATMSVTAQDLNVVVAAGGNLYLAWNYSVTSGTTSSNAQALGIDNVSIQAAAASVADDATLSNLTTSVGVLNPVFSSSVLNYTVSLPFGTTATPTVVATTSNPQATAVVTPAADVTSATIADRTTTVVVTSQDLSQTKTYTVVFNVPTAPSTDASLSSLTSSVSSLAPAFNTTVYYYTVLLPYGSTATPTVTATPTNAFAQVTIVPAANVASTDSLLRTTVVTVVAEDGTTTLVYKVQFNVSQLTVIDVADIAALRAGLTDGTVYRLTGEAILSFQQSYRNQKFVQDATAAIQIDDVNNVITTTYAIGDGITNLIGTLSLYNQMLQFTPTVNPAAATSTGNVVVAHLKTVSQVVTADQAKLIKILNSNFVNPTGNFAATTNYNLSDATGTIVFRTNFTGADYIGTPVPTYAVDVTGIFIQYIATMQITSRFASDITQSTSVNLANYEDFTFEAYPNPSTGNINFSFNLDKSEKVVFTIKDITGKEIYSYSDNLGVGSQLISWNNSENVESGVYFYSVTINNMVKNGKLIVTK